MAVVLTLALQQDLWAKEFITNTPVPTPYEHVFLNVHSSLSQRKNNTRLEAPALEADVGVYPEFQIHAVIPAILIAPKGKSTHYAYGDVRLGLKHRFIQETEKFPQVAIYPKFTFPSGDPNKGIGNATWTGTLPFWMQKNWGTWSVTTGGGYGFNPAKEKFNYLFGGILIQKQINQNLMLGNEFFAEGPRSLSRGSRVLYNFGGSYYFKPNFYVLFSSGHSIRGARELIGFLGFGVTWGP